MERREDVLGVDPEERVEIRMSKDVSMNVTSSAQSYVEIVGSDEPENSILIPRNDPPIFLITLRKPSIRRDVTREPHLLPVLPRSLQLRLDPMQMLIPSFVRIVERTALNGGIGVVEEQRVERYKEEVV